MAWGAPAAAAPPISTAFDLGGWVEPLARAERALDAADAPRAGRWLSLVPPGGPLERARQWLQLRRAASESAEPWPAVRPLLEGCTAPRDRPWAREAIAAWLQAAPASPDMIARPALLPYAVEIRTVLTADGPKPELMVELDRMLLRGAPDAPEARARADALGLHGIAEFLTLGERVQRAEDLLRSHDNRRAEREAQAWLASGTDPTSVCRLRYVIGRAERKRRRYGTAQLELRRAIESCRRSNDPQTELKALLTLAHVLRIRGLPDGIRGLRTRAQSLNPEHSYLDDLLFLEGDAWESAGATRRAHSNYATIIENYPRGDMVPSAAWRLARADIDRRPEAAKQLLKIITQHEHADARDRHRARYWTARLSADPAAELARLAETVSFHGVLAREWLDEHAPSVALTVRRRLTDAASADAGPHSESVTGRGLARLGLTSWTPGALEEAACSASAERRFEIAAELVQHGHHAAAQRVLRPAQTAFIDVLRPDTLWAWRTAYSRPHPAAFRAAAEEFDLEGWLLLAVAREESTFAADIVSWAGAVGLVQLMPATALGAHGALHPGRALDLEQLTEPELNLRLGAYVLSTELRRFQGLVPLGVAAYNAGPGLAARFRRRGPPRFDRWVESVPVAQTRGYIMRVLESWARYRLLYDRARPFADFPDRIR